MIIKKKIELAIFDMDGTLFTSKIDWQEVKKKLKVGETSILEKIYNGDTVDINALRYLEEIEEKNTLDSELIPGSFDFITSIAQMGIKTSLITNNSRTNAEYLLQKYELSFDTLITRDNKMWKPSPAGFKYTMTRLGASPESTISIGDSDFDVTASIKAGISDIFIINSAILKEKYPLEITYFKDYFELSSMIFGS